MPLASQMVPYNFGFGGQDQRSDDRFVPLGRPKELRNVRFPKLGKISRRGQFGTPTGTTATAVTLKKMFSVGESGLLGYGVDSSGVRSWHMHEPSTGALVNVGGAAVPKAWLSNATPKRQTFNGLGVFGGQFSVIDVAAGASQSLYVGINANADIEWTIVDERTKTTLASGQIVSNAVSIRCIALPGTDTFVLGEQIAANLVVRTISVSAGVTTRVTINNVQANWDWAVYTGALYVATHSSTTTTRIVLTKVDTGTWATSSANIDLGIVPLQLCVVVPYSIASTRITVMANEATNGTRGVSYSSALAVTQALWVVHAGGIGAGGVMTAAERSDNTIELFETGAPASNASVTRYEVTVGAAASSTTVLNNLVLASKPIVSTLSKDAFVLLGFQSNDSLQHSLYLFQSCAIVARYTLGGWKGSIATTHLPNLQLWSDGGTATTRYMGGCLVLSRLYASQAGTTREMSLMTAWFDLDAAEGLIDVDDEDTKLITGGFLTLYDGQQAVENGFLAAPEITNSASAGGGSLPVLGTYLFKATYQWTDAKGRVHRSAASQARSHTLTGANNAINVDVNVLSATRHTEINIEIWRTLNGGTTYKLARVFPVYVNGGAAGSQTISITGSDTTLDASTPLPQQGTILPSQQPSCPVAIASTGRRVHVTPGDDRLAITEGKERVEGEGAAFFEGVERRITLGGVIEALGTSGERWVAFKERGMFFASGEGADDSGGNDTLTQFEQFSSDVGCSLPSTIVQTTYGTIFRAERGFYLLGRDGGLTYLGAGVEDDVDTVAAGAQITDSAYDKDNGTIHFQTTASECYVLTLFQAEAGYDWRWSVDDSVAFVGLAFTNGRLYASRATAQTAPVQRYEPAGTYAGGSGQTFTMRVRTGWIPLFGPQGRGRLWDIIVLGRSSATAQLTAQIAYDYDDTLVQSEVADAASVGNAPYQWRFEPNQQQCEAVMLDLSQNAGVAGGDAELNQIVFEIGVQPGRFRLPSNKRAA
jgi:hypothetical protein